MSFKQPVRIHFDDCDPAGIVFFGNHFKLAHRAFENFVVANGFTWEEWFNTPDYGVPLIHVEADYKSPLHQGQEYQSVVTIAAIGSSSITVHTRFETLNGDLCSQVETVHVFVSAKTKSKMPIPESIRQRLEPHCQPS